jgi:hypothetical protein
LSVVAVAHYCCFFFLVLVILPLPHLFDEHWLAVRGGKFIA